jgi:hypothetical protein
MDIVNFYNCLSDNEKSILYRLLKDEKTKSAEEIHIEDWAEKADISVRLFNILKSRFSKSKCNKTAHDITFSDFMGIRGAGQKSWHEFTLARGY